LGEQRFALSTSAPQIQSSSPDLKSYGILDHPIESRVTTTGVVSSPQ
jgi:hypothetical protein